MVEEQAEVRAFHGFIQIGVGEDDVGALASELERDALQVGFRGGFHDELAHFSGSGERDFIHIHVTCDGCAGRGAVSGEEVDHTFRESGFHDQLADAQCRKRRLLGRLHNNRISGCERGRELPGQHQHGEVPGNDLADNAYRFVPRIAEERAVDGNCFAVDLVGPSGEIAEAADGGCDVHCFRDADRFSVVQGFEGSQFVGVLFNQIGQAVQHAPAFGCGELAPRTMFEGAAGCFHSFFDVGCVGFRNLADFLASGRIDGCKSLAGFARDPAVVDQEFSRGHSDPAFSCR